MNTLSSFTHVIPNMHDFIFYLISISIKMLWTPIIFYCMRKTHLTHNIQHILLCVPQKKVSHGCESDKQCQIFLTSQLSLLPLFSTVAERAQYAANRKNTCKLSKQLHQFDNIHVKNARNTTKQRNALQILFFIWLCCEH